MIFQELDLFEEDAPKIGKYSNYFRLYDEILSRFSGPVRLLEIGVRHGGSMELWQRVLPEGSEIVGIDIMPQTRQFSNESVRIVIGDQGDKGFLKEFSEQNAPFDIIIDDGSHISAHQIASFEMLFQKSLKFNGYYVIEDVHTSYWRDYGGGMRKSGSCIEFFKRLVEDVNTWHGTRQNPTIYSTMIRRISFESSLIVVEKEKMKPPEPLQFGSKTIDFESVPDDGAIGKLYNYIRRNDRLKGLVRRSRLAWWIANLVINRRQ